jgi:hypothetical protein
MGNTLITANNNRNINDTILGKRVKEILLNQEIVVDKDLKTNKDITQKVNVVRGCCMDIVKPDPTDNEFITVNLPEGLTPDEDKFCKDKGRCIGSSKLGLQVKGDRKKICQKNLVPGKTGVCDAIMVNKCAKDLYDTGCIIVKTNKKGRKVRVWNAKNRNCFTKRGALIYGSEECACINSATGFSLNTNPSNKIKGGNAFRKNDENPFGLDGSADNGYTKYSLDIFGYEPQYQKPQIFDARCASKKAAVGSGESAPYLLDDYKVKNLTICMNQINIKDSDIGAANFSNIKQNNSCGGGGKMPKVEKNPEERAVKVKEDKLVSKRESDRIEKEAAQKLEKDNADKAKAKEAQVAKAKKNISHNKEVKELKDKAKDDKVAGIKKAIVKSKDTKLEADKLKEENINKQKELDDAKEKATKAVTKLAAEKAATEKAAAEKAATEKAASTKNMYYGIAIFVIIAIVLFFLLKGKGKSKRRSRDDDF